MADNSSRAAVATSEEMAALMLDDLGMIRDCNREGETLFKYRRNELVAQHISLLLPQLAKMELMQNGQPNARLCFLSRTGHNFQAVTQVGEQLSCKLFFNLLDRTGYGQMLVIVRPVETVTREQGQHTGKDSKNS